MTTNKRLRKYCKISDDSLQLLKDKNINGFYSEAIGRSVCSCGYIDNQKLYVCPSCGNQNFIETNWRTIYASPEEVFVFDKSTKMIQKEKLIITWNSGSNEGEILIKEENAVTPILNERGVKSSHSLKEEELEKIYELIEKNSKSFSKTFIQSFDLSKSCGGNRILYNAVEWKRFFDNKEECPVAWDYIKTYSNSNKELLLSLLNYNNRYSTGDAVPLTTIIDDCGIPNCLLPHLNKKILDDFTSYSYYRSEKEKTDAKYSRIPDDMKNIIIHYYLEGLIDKDTFLNTPFISLDLLENYPEIQKIQFKKYFKNLKSNHRYYYGYRNGDISYTMDDMYSFYIQNELPIDSGNFDFRNFCAMQNNKILEEAGWDKLTIDTETSDMENNPVQSLIKIASVRRKRKKEED